MAQPPSMSRLIEQLTRLPGIGEKTATRMAFHILRADREYATLLAEAVLSVKNDTKLCSECFALTEVDPCRLCTDGERAGDVVCVVEEPADLLAVERAGQLPRAAITSSRHARAARRHRARRSQDPAAARPHPAARRPEVIVATNPTVEGEATAIYLAKLLKPLGVRVTRIAHGIPVGGDLEYTDVMTGRPRPRRPARDVTRIATRKPVRYKPVIPR
jgi:recombination protein RecR